MKQEISYHDAVYVCSYTSGHLYTHVGRQTVVEPCLKMSANTRSYMQVYQLYRPIILLIYACIYITPVIYVILCHEQYGFRIRSCETQLATTVNV